MPLCDEFVTYCLNFDFKIRRDHQKNFLWTSRLWVSRRKEPILGYVPKNDENKNSGSKGLTNRKQICIGGKYFLLFWKLILIFMFLTYIFIQTIENLKYNENIKFIFSLPFRFFRKYYETVHLNLKYHAGKSRRFFLKYFISQKMKQL